MPSPFPGMNPYLEQPDVWLDFHQAYITAIRNALTPQIRPSYMAKIDDHVYIHELSGDERMLLGRPDVSVMRLERSSSTAGARTVAAPAFGNVPLGVDTVHEPFIEIRDRETREVITVIELLSPTNKTPGSGREQYVGKRKAILASNTHLVEIDLLRGGERMPVEDLPACEYVVMVSRSYDRPRVELWPMRLRDPLPLVPVPLRIGDRDATLSLGQLLHDQFDAAGYEDYVYRTNPQPPLAAGDATWAEDMSRKT
ncbi:MAG: DUF4058 family protein [Pirellulales bacterium]